MSLKIKDGDYVPDNTGGLRRADGAEALVQRVLFRLCAHRGAFPFLENLGSRLWQLGRVAPADRESAAKQYVAEALEGEEGVSVTDVTLSEHADGLCDLTARLSYEGGDLSVQMTVQ
jgi:phage gp46-like protein